jgi:hypothetical protein
LIGHLRGKPTLSTALSLLPLSWSGNIKKLSIATTGKYWEESFGLALLETRQKQTLDSSETKEQLEGNKQQVKV